VAADLAPVLAAAVRAPSAHNAQPWRLEATGDDAYDVAYAQADRLLADPDDRDGLLAIGAFIETMALAAEHRGLTLTFAPGVVERGDRLVLGRLALSPLDREPDPSRRPSNVGSRTAIRTTARRFRPASATGSPSSAARSWIRGPSSRSSAAPA
jgi:hypothetical protein